MCPCLVSGPRGTLRLRQRGIPPSLPTVGRHPVGLGGGDMGSACTQGVGSRGRDEFLRQKVHFRI